MSSQHTTPSDDNAPGFRAIRFNMDWITRPLFGILLGLIALGVVALGVEAIAIFAGVGFILAALEWHRCVSGGTPDRIQVAITATSVILAELALIYSGHFWAGLAVVGLGTVGAIILALYQGDENPIWRAASTPYLAIPALCLLQLRSATNGTWVVIGMLLIVWATDTGALIFGNLIGGKRIAPKLSPGKTWAGTIGGSLCAALVYAAYVNFLFPQSNLWIAPFAFAFSFVAHGGDLFESLFKRRFGVKDSGAIIPGHGGILDRVDLTLAAAPAMALLVLVLHFNPLFGVHA